jgi:hypothetical protein
MSLFDRFKANRKFFPSNTDFDLLYSEYQALNPPVPDVLSGGQPNPDKALLESIKARRDNPSLPREEKFSWDDIYRFELTLLKYLDFESIRRRVVSLRERFGNILGKDKLDEYLKTNPLDPAKAAPSDIEMLRADARDLLQRIYRSIAAGTSREGLGKWLTYWAGAIFVLIIIIAVLLLLLKIFGVAGAPIKVAFIAGAIGGLISILQRLQSIPSEGDPIYSLATFWYGAYARYVSTLTGAIFGVLLYLLFTGGILAGRFFPVIATPSGADTGEMCGEMTIPNKLQAPLAPSPSPTASPTPSPNKNANAANANSNGNTKGNENPNTGNTDTVNTNTGSNTGGGNLNTGNLNKPGNTNTNKPGNTNTTNTNTNTNTSTANTNTSNTNTSNTNTSNTTSTAAQAKLGNTGLRRFLNCSGPESGFDYALLIIWCFLAGFAERLVPDTLNRLVEENIPAKKT